MNRAYSLITIKAVDEKRRIFTGIATTPEVDRVEDTINPLGASFKNPITLLHQHKPDVPVGQARFKRPTKEGIEFEAEIPIIAEPPTLKERVDVAWGELKAGLVRAVSIGFKPIKYAFIENGGIEFQEIEIYELSLVSIPANASAVISDIKSIDAQLRKAAGVPEPTRPQNPIDPKPPAASGKKQLPVVRLTPPASGKSKPSTTPQEGKDMKTVSEQIAALEAKRAATAAGMEQIMQKSIESGETLDADGQEKFDTAKADIDAIDGQLKRLKDMEAILAKTAKPVRTVETPAGTTPTAVVEVKHQPKLLPGMGFVQLAKVKMASQLTGIAPLLVARGMYGDNSQAFAIVQKANEVAPGANASGNWAADLVSAEGGVVAEFLEYLRPETILGKFGVGGVPGLRMLDFYRPYVTQTGGGAAYWVGEGKPKPLTSFDFDRSTLTPLKIANICVLTEENIRYSSPNSDLIVRDQLAAAIIAGIDVALIDPANNGSANVKPASILYGADSIVAEGTGDADDIRKDVKSLINKFVLANNMSGNGVIIMSQSNAVGLSIMTNALGQPEFPGMTRNGGTLLGYPTIVSQHIGDVVAMVDASQIFLGDEGGIDVAISREASLEMKSVPTQDPMAPGAGASLVSMFQNNLVAIRAERTINWKRARETAVAYLTSVEWGGPVNT